MAPRIVVIGNSHVWAIRHAVDASADPDFATEALSKDHPLDPSDAVAIAALAGRVGPTDVLGLALQGNYHNVVALLNQPEPFWMAGGEERGRLIPQDMLLHHLEQQMSRTLNLSRAIAGAIPHRRLVVIDPPPPSGDAAHIRANPSIFAAKLDLGVSPDATRVQTYRLQSEVYRRHAKALDAVYLPSNPATHAENGMLARDYWKADPTHANAAYGAFVVADLRRIAGDLT